MKNVTTDDIIRLCAQKFGTDVDAVRGAQTHMKELRGPPEEAFAAACYLLRKHTKSSYRKCADKLGGTIDRIRRGEERGARWKRWGAVYEVVLSQIEDEIKSIEGKTDAHTG